MICAPHPLVLPLLLSFAAGVLVLQWQPELPSSTSAEIAAAVALASAVALHAAVRKVASQRRVASLRRLAPLRLATLAALVAAFAVGFAYAAARAELRLSDALPAEWEGEDIALSGIVDDLPQLSERGARFAFAVERVETRGAVVPSRLSLSWYAAQRKDGGVDAVPALAGGERWHLVVRLKRPHGTVNPHGFDIEAWLLENGIRATGYVRNDDRNRREDAFAGRAADHVLRARESTRARIVAALPEAAYAGVIVALTIGEQRAISEAQWRVFNRTGIAHLISISGLHVTVFATLAAGFAYALARRSVALTSRIPARKVAAIVGVVFATVYVLLAGCGVPAVRTLLMLAVASLGLVLARPGTAAAIWLWALVTVLVWDPWAGLSAGFWLSFGAVGALLYAGTGRLSSPPPADRRARLLRTMQIGARAQTVVTLALVPGTLALFQQVSLISPIANALAIPVVTFGVVPFALCAIVVPLDLPWQIAHAVFAALMVALDALAATPAAAWQQHAPPAWAVVLALGGVALLVAPRGVPGRVLGGIALLPLFVVQPTPPDPGTFRMTVLDVGQGLAVVVQTHDHALLYDTGPRYHEEADAGGRIVAPFLRALGIRHLDAIIITHQDTDHSGGALSLLATVPVDLLLSSLAQGHPILARRALDHEVAARCEAGQRWSWDDVRFTVLQPTAALYAVPQRKANDLSCVLRIDSRHGSVLLTGDVEARGEQDLLRRDANMLKADVIVVPHHGSRTSSTPAFVAAVEAVIAVYAAGYRNRFGHPRPDIVARYESAGARGYRTDLDGALTFTFAPETALAPRAGREHDRRYWRETPAREGAKALD